MQTAIIRVKIDDYDYQYDQSFIVKHDIDKINKLLEIVEDAKQLDTDELVDKYDNDNPIDIIENYISNNLSLIKCARYDIEL